MFLKVLKMEWKRAFHPFHVLLGVILITASMLGSSNWHTIEYVIEIGGTEQIGSIEILSETFYFSMFACVMVVILSSLYSGSFCRDSNSHYLRMILARTDVTTYTQCRFIANTGVIVISSILAMYLFVLILSPLMPLMPTDGTQNSYYYIHMIEKYPFLYVGMTGLIFGLVAAAGSSIGLLYSSYDANAFVSIALSSLSFYLAVTYIPYESLFSVLNIVTMNNTVGNDLPRILVFLWTLVYMFSIIGICGLLFYRRMKWRVENGYL